MEICQESVGNFLVRLRSWLQDLATWECSLSKIWPTLIRIIVADDLQSKHLYHYLDVSCSMLRILAFVRRMMMGSYSHGASRHLITSDPDSAASLGLSEVGCVQQLVRWDGEPASRALRLPSQDSSSDRPVPWKSWIIFDVSEIVSAR